MKNKFIDQKLLRKMFTDKLIRTSITKNSFMYFFHFYYSHYVKYPTADFQKQIINFLANSPNENYYLISFRGSGKSTLITTAYPIWAILGTQEKKFVLILCHTRTQAKQHMMSIKKELEENQLLKKDLGPFQDESDEWGSYSLVFNKSGARITVGSTEQSIRGIRHNEHRPDLIILDDVEDMQSAKTREGRDKIYNWLVSEIIPCGDKNTRLIIVGNLLHEDSLLMRIKEELSENIRTGKFQEIPLLNPDGSNNWPGKFPTTESIEDEKKRVGNDVSWYREYLLQIISSEEQIIKKDWIKYYSPEIQFYNNHHTHYYTGIDLAISLKDSADYTAMVTARAQGFGKDLIINILPNVINRKMRSQETINMAELVSTTSHHSLLLVEDNGMQKVFVDLLKNDNYKVEGVRSVADKHSRLTMVSSLFESGKIFFPDHGAEELIQQLLGFGKEKHDDLVDSLSLLLLKIIEKHGRRGTRPVPKFDRL